MSVIVAVKGNREEKITENDKEKFLSAGYDIVEDGVRTVAPSKTVTFAEHSKVLKENKGLLAKVEELENSADPKALEVAVKEATEKTNAENKALKEENKALNKELEALKKAGK